MRGEARERQQWANASARKEAAAERENARCRRLSRSFHLSIVVLGLQIRARAFGHLKISNRPRLSHDGPRLHSSAVCAREKARSSDARVFLPSAILPNQGRKKARSEKREQRRSLRNSPKLDAKLIAEKSRGGQGAQSASALPLSVARHPREALLDPSTNKVVEERSQERLLKRVSREERERID